MHTSVLVVFLCLIVGLSVAFDARETLYHREKEPKGWENLGRAEPGQSLNFYIALRQQNVDVLEEKIYDISHPRSPNYGNWMTISEILDLIAPPKEDHDSVVSWLVANNIEASEIKSMRDSLHITTTVEKVEQLFNTEMYSFVNKASRTRIAHLGSISVPSSMKIYIDMVSGLSLFPPSRKLKADIKDMPAPNANAWAIPPHLRTVYNIPANVHGTNAKNLQAATEFEWPGCFSYSDMLQYSQLIEMPFNNISRVIPPTGVDYVGCDGESAMDLQLMSNIGSGVPTAYFTNEHWIYEMTQTIMSLPNPPLVYSLSWGWMEFDECNQMLNSECSVLGVNAEQYVSRTNTELLKVANMGLSVLVCTQDEGAPSDQNQICSLDETSTPVWPIYPASSPWVTSIGATTLVAPGTFMEKMHAKKNLGSVCETYYCNNGTEEVVAMSSDDDTLFTSGGGFSNFTIRPSYQVTAVGTFLKSKAFKPPDSLFGYKNRAYPDLSAAGSHMLN